MGFDIMDLQKGRGPVQARSKADEGRAVLKYIDVEDLVPSEDNFYSMSAIDELATLIELSGGVKQPGLVVPHNLADNLCVVVKRIFSPSFFRSAKSPPNAVADDVLIPIRPDVFSFSGLLDLVEQVDSVREAVNPGLTLRGAFFTHWQRREPFEAARRSLEESGICHVFQTAISYNPKVPESTLEEMPLCAFAPRSWAAIQYKKLTAEYLALTDSGKGKEGR